VTISKEVGRRCAARYAAAAASCSASAACKAWTLRKRGRSPGWHQSDRPRASPQRREAASARVRPPWAKHTFAIEEHQRRDTLDPLSHHTSMSGSSAASACKRRIESRTTNRVPTAKASHRSSRRPR
jgi:hypothetical protein